ncbi:type VI secretion system baseplate subunit TssK, partial [Escherichia coli]|nr:type VI secretion system baseplate subunit TssK [Escherichia coli]
IIQHALPGVSLTEVDTSIAGLPEGENILWLKVEKSSEMWRKIEEQKKIAFYWSRIPDDLSVELVMSHAR